MTMFKGYRRWAGYWSVLLAATAAGCGAADGAVNFAAEDPEDVGSVTSALTTAALHSLLITDLNIVAHPERTVEPCLAVPADADNKEWSLPYLLKVHAARSGINSADLVDNWLSGWANETTLVNGHAGKANGVEDIIERWPKNSAGKFRLEKAPFRLSAIVSRLDLRNLRPEGEPLGGEVRFVFGLTRSTDCGSEANETTLILEYSPGTTNENAVLAWAKRWYDLGNLNKSSAEYAQTLQGLTEDTIRKGKLERIRTNAVRGSETVTPGWFLSEFVPANGWLKRSTVKQTPFFDLRSPRNSNRPKAAAFIAANIANLDATFRTPRKGSMEPVASFYRVPDRFDNDGIFRGAWANVVKTRGTFWDFPRPAEVDAATWSRARHQFSLGTCDGCHSGEILGQGGTSPPFHITARNANSPANLSTFLTGPITVIDPVDGTQRQYDEMQRRKEDLHWLANEMPLGNPIYGNYYKLRFVNSSRCIDVAGASTASGALVKQYACHGQENQRLALVAGARPLEFRLKLKHSGMCLDIENASTAAGARIVQKPCGSDTQLMKWVVPAGTPEAVVLNLKHSGKCLNVAGGGTGDNVQVVQSDCAIVRSQGLHFVE